jgi:integrase
MLIAMGFNLKDVQEWMGHSDIKMTANIYAHLDVARKMSMADRLGERLSTQTRNPLEQAVELGKK